jgi:23S rRNA pseudouridine1911/1915/1917 synthase
MNKPKIIFEDQSLLVLDKPAGWVVNRAETTLRLPTIQEWLKPVKGESDSDFVKRRGIVHRLDKETSGLLLVAKTGVVFEALQKQFKERRIIKKYLCLVHGVVSPKEGRINAPVLRHPYNKKKFGVFLGGREAVTDYKVVRSFGNQFSLVEARPKTGRTHQIRVHFKYIGHPIVADELYVGRKTQREDKKWCPRQFLQAFYLGFYHPVSKKFLEFEIDLPGELKKALKSLK